MSSAGAHIFPSIRNTGNISSQIRGIISHRKQNGNGPPCPPLACPVYLSLLKWRTAKVNNQRPLPDAKGISPIATLLRQPPHPD